jgi:hypothetical protein
MRQKLAPANNELSDQSPRTWECGILPDGVRETFGLLNGISMGL